MGSFSFRNGGFAREKKGREGEKRGVKSVLREKEQSR